MPSAIIVGAGLAGLTAARQLHRENWTVSVIDARDRVGGRIQTDPVDGFLLDHGFQVFLTGYVVAQSELDLTELRLGEFQAGALIWIDGKHHRVCDPLRSKWYLAPWHCLETLVAPVGSIADKLRIALFRNRVCQADPAHWMNDREGSAKERLEQFGFSPKIIHRFFRPFFGGIFLDESLSVSAGMMEFIFRTFSLGAAALPEQGMQAIPNQIARDLPAASIRLNTTAKRVSDGCVELSDGETLLADHVIVATEEPAAKRLIAASHSQHDKRPPPLKAASTCCLYFDVPDPPIQEATLMLNGDQKGVINNLCFPSFAQPSYAPAGRSLLSVSTIGQTETVGTELLTTVRTQLVEWFGKRAENWRHLRTYQIPYALPNQTPQASAKSFAPTQISDRIWRCGDYCESGSIEGAIVSGLKVARRVQDSTTGTDDFESAKAAAVPANAPNKCPSQDTAAPAVGNTPKNNVVP